MLCSRSVYGSFAFVFGPFLGFSSFFGGGGGGQIEQTTLAFTVLWSWNYEYTFKTVWLTRYFFETGISSLGFDATPFGSPGMSDMVRSHERDSTSYHNDVGRTVAGPRIAVDPLVHYIKSGYAG